MPKKLIEIKDKVTKEFTGMSTKAKVALSTAVGVVGTTVPALAVDPTPLINVTGINFMSVLSEITALIPTILPVIISFIAFRKGFGFLKSALKGA